LTISWLARGTRWRLLLAVACSVRLLRGAPAYAQAPAKPQRPGGLPKLSGMEGCTLTFGASSTLREKVQQYSGYVDLDCGQFRIQADRMTYDRDKNTVDAEGNVSLTWQGNRLAGKTLHYDLGDRTGSVSHAVGTFPPDALVVAEEMDKISDDVVLIRDAVFTSCTQPVPYWSLHIRKGRFHLNHYAYLSGVSMRARGVPFFYTPYLIWPIKGERATGLLFPQWGTSRTLGLFVGEQFFWAMARNADLTVEGDYYEKAGGAGGIEFNWLPSAHGRVVFDAYGLNDQRTNQFRYKTSLRAEQGFGEGWRAVADLNAVSDFAYYFDFARTLAGASTPATVSQVNLIRNWSYYSLTVRAQQREQFFLSNTAFGRILREDLKQDMLPEIEFRGRSRRLGSLPIYLSFQSRADLAGRNDRTFDLDIDLDGTAGGRFNADYGRLDVGGRLALPATPFPWLDVESALTLRETYWSASQTSQLLDADGMLRSGGEIFLDRPLNRNFVQATVELTGPRLIHVWEPPEGQPGRRFKHVIEPRLLWQFAPSLDYREQVTDPRSGKKEVDPVTGQPVLSSAIPFDEIEFSSNAFQTIHQVTYGVRQRLLARRPAAPVSPPPSPGARQPGATGPPWGPASLAPERPPAPATPAAPQPDYYPETPAAGSAAAAAGAAAEAAQGSFTSAEAPAPEEPSTPAVPGPFPGAAAAGAARRGSGGTPAEAVEAAGVLAAWPYTPAGAPPPVLPPPAAPPTSHAPVAENPVEIANLEISQTYSFETFLSSFKDRSRHYSPINLTARINPSLNMSVDLRTDYDLLQKTFLSETLTTSARSGRLGFVNLSWVRRRRAANTINISGGTALFERKLLLDLHANYDEKASRLLERGLRVGYYSQCCGFIAEYDRRDFFGIQRQEFRFIVDLKGIGKFLDLNAGTTP